MKTHFKYIEWRDTKGLHEDTLQTLSELAFLKDELQFLQDLVADHTLELIYGKPFEESRMIAQQISKHKKKLNKLVTSLKDHKNELKVLMDDIDVPNELRDYKEMHYNLMIDTMDFHTNVKRTKRDIFSMLSDIMKKSKAKRLQ
tara:strand:+ start:43802 stop:44233 length:432 start_codon:yes stop_codon:yes gene_type:complete